MRAIVCVAFVVLVLCSWLTQSLASGIALTALFILVTVCYLYLLLPVPPRRGSGGDDG